jgi:hypothetical protein
MVDPKSEHVRRYTMAQLDRNRLRQSRLIDDAEQEAQRELRVLREQEHELLSILKNIGVPIDGL